jgi:triphosphatase
MPKEIELKLILRESEIPVVMAMDWLKAKQIIPWTKKRFVSTYYDSPEQVLFEHGYVLRIRQIDDQFIQTLKSAGTSSDGLSQREEDEWPLEEDRLDLRLLPVEVRRLLDPAVKPRDDKIVANAIPHANATPHASVIPHTSVIPRLDRGIQTADGAIGAILNPIFITDFHRTQCLIEWEQTTIELALDHGDIRVEDWKEPICEMELEIKHGETPVLMQLAKTLKQTISLKPFDQSKAERGYRLQKVYSANAHAQ